jgi:hypothetical protein
MATVNLDPDFKEFLRSLTCAGVRFLVLGGYAVIHYGYGRVTGDLDVWIAIDPDNAGRVSLALQSFGGFPSSAVKPSIFTKRGKIFVFGRKPLRIDILTAPSGVEFDDCYARRLEVDWDGVTVPLIALKDLRVNKQSSGRHKDLADLSHLPATWPPEAPSPKRRRPRRKDEHRDPRSDH